MTRLLIPVMSTLLLIIGCSSDNITDPELYGISTDHRVRNMYEPIDQDDWWFAGVPDIVEYPEDATIVLYLTCASEWTVYIVRQRDSITVWSISGSSEAGTVVIMWNLKDSNGKLVPPGLYWIVAEAWLYYGRRELLIEY